MIPPHIAWQSTPPNTHMLACQKKALKMEDPFFCSRLSGTFLNLIQPHLSPPPPLTSPPPPFLLDIDAGDFSPRRLLFHFARAQALRPPPLPFPFPLRPTPLSSSLSCVPRAPLFVVKTTPSYPSWSPAPAPPRAPPPLITLSARGGAGGRKHAPPKRLSLFSKGRPCQVCARAPSPIFLPPVAPRAFR
jgi:hypothetical protein